MRLRLAPGTARFLGAITQAFNRAMRDAR
jgi:hypothetical protein